MFSIDRHAKQGIAKAYHRGKICDMQYVGLVQNRLQSATIGGLLFEKYL